jgi:hypothetical protein
VVVVVVNSVDGSCAAVIGDDVAGDSGDGLGKVLSRGAVCVAALTEVEVEGVV